MKKKFLLIGGLGAIMLVSAVSYAFASTNSEHVTGTLSNTENSTNEQSSTSVSTTATDTASDLVIPTYASIKDRMLNAIDNYKHVKGSYHSILKPINEDQIVEFEISEEKNPGSYIKITDKKAGKDIETKFEGEGFITLDNKNKNYEVGYTGEILNIKPEGPRHYKDEEGNANYIYRNDPAFAQSNDITFPQKYAFWLNDETQNYKIVGEETLLDRKVVVIEGTLDSFLAKKHQATNFKFWVDSETGILLKLQETNEKKEIMNSIEILDIKINSGVDRARFKVEEPIGYKNISKDLSKQDRVPEKSQKK